jgi:predicted metal-dependent phosphoesterase TrpH
MSTPRIAVVLLIAAIALGTGVDRPRARPPIFLGGYRVVAADFHTHSSTWSDSALTPFGIVLEAERQRLDAVAITGHRQTHEGKWGRWFSGIIGGPTVIVGEEIPEIEQHLVAIGIENSIPADLDVAMQIAEVHKQGGLAIAAHPGPHYWSAFEPVMDALDGTEVCHPAAFVIDDAQGAFEQFAARTPAAAIGSSDFHGIGLLAACRTFVFATDISAPAILDAVRAKRTVVYGVNGKAYGNAELIRLAAADGRLPLEARADPSTAFADRLSQMLGAVGLVALLLWQRRG